MTSVRHSIESLLYRQGFRHPGVRELVYWQLCVAGITSVLALGVSLLAFQGLAWGLTYVAGAGLATVNFWHLAKFGQTATGLQAPVLAMLLRFYGRLILTGLAIFALIIWAQLPVAPLLAGISTVVMSALVYGATKLFGNNA